MQKIVIFYGSSVGNTRFVAEKLGKIIPNSKVVCVKDATKEMVLESQHMIIGTSTWGIGSFQDDFYNFANVLASLDLSNHKAALFGLGDQFNYPDSFCDGMGKLYDILQKQGCTLVGEWPSDDYTFSESQALRDGQLVGLALDEDNEPDLTTYRIKKWSTQVLSQMGIKLED